LQKTLEDVRNIAIMRPTEANVRRYMEQEAQVVARASTLPTWRNASPGRRRNSIPRCRVGP